MHWSKKKMLSRNVKRKRKARRDLNRARRICAAWPSIVEVEALSGFRVRCVYSDGVEGIADLSDLAEFGAFERWHTVPGFFEQVKAERHRLVWDDMLDVSGDSIREEIIANGEREHA